MERKARATERLNFSAIAAGREKGLVSQEDMDLLREDEGASVRFDQYLADLYHAVGSDPGGLDDYGRGLLGDYERMLDGSSFPMAPMHPPYDRIPLAEQAAQGGRRPGEGPRVQDGPGCWQALYAASNAYQKGDDREYALERASESDGPARAFRTAEKDYQGLIRLKSIAQGRLDDSRIEPGYEANFARMAPERQAGAMEKIGARILEARAHGVIEADRFAAMDASTGGLIARAGERLEAARAAEKSGLRLTRRDMETLVSADLADEGLDRMMGGKPPFDAPGRAGALAELKHEDPRGGRPDPVLRKGPVPAGRSVGRLEGVLEDTVQAGRDGYGLE